jgi:hypothetical protein
MKTGQGLWAITLLTTAFILEPNPASRGQVCRVAGPLYAVCITNSVAVFNTNGAVTVRFDIAGGTNGWTCDVFSTTDPAGLTRWVWAANGRAGDTIVLGDQPAAGAFYVLGTPQDTDADGLTDAFERLASKTDPDRWDTDGDGVSDRDEVRVYHTDPRNQDTGGTGAVDQPFRVIITCPRTTALGPE